MSISSIHGARLQSPNGIAAATYAQQKSLAGDATAKAAATKPSLPAENAGQLAAAIASAMAQLGLATSPGPATGPTARNTASGTTMAAGAAPRAILPGSRQVRQYTELASTFSNLARALDSGAGNAPPGAGQTQGLAGVLQGLWTTLGAASGSAADTGQPAIPNLPAFVQSLARHFGESGIPHLRGVFVDTQA